MNTGSAPRIDDRRGNMKKPISVILALVLLLAALPALADQPLPAGPGSITDPSEAKVICPVCGFCPHPLGLCIFLWIAIGLVIAAITVLIVRTVRKKKAARAAASTKRTRGKGKY
jgi:hypothetical protein